MSDIKVGDTVEYIRADTPELTRGEHYVVVSDDRMECSSIAVHNNSGDVMWRLASRFRKVTEARPKEDIKVGDTVEYIGKEDTSQFTVGKHYAVMSKCTGGLCLVCNTGSPAWVSPPHFRKVTETQPKEITPQPNETAAHSSKIAPKEIDWTKPIQTGEEIPCEVAFMGEEFVVCNLTAPDLYEGELFVVDRKTGSTIRGNYHAENVPITHTLTGWVNVFSDSFMSGIHSTKKLADGYANNDRIACIDLSKHNITYEEGEGLD